jgi:sulfur carrier protein ThiS
MKMQVTFLVRKEKYETQAGVTLKEALQLLGLTTETHMALRDGIVLSEFEVLQEGDVFTLIPVISGG